MYRRLLGFLVVLLAVAACAAPDSSGPKIRVENAWARPGPATSMSGDSGMPDMQGMSANETTSAAYFVIVNDGSEADALIGAATEVAGKAEMHETRMQGDVAEMVPVPRVDIPGHGRVEFKPGGYHVMLVGLTRDLKVGGSLKLILRFEKSGSISVDVPIRAEGQG
jgi:periplasmic copper chaperone A